MLGKTFTAQALAALSRAAEDELAPLLPSLVRKEVLGVQSDPRSPEHGQYGFLQDLVRHVAYETLARSERKSRHLPRPGTSKQRSRGGRDRRGACRPLPLGLRRRARCRGRRSDPRSRARRTRSRGGARCVSGSQRRSAARIADAAALALDPSEKPDCANGRHNGKSREAARRRPGRTSRGASPCSRSWGGLTPQPGSRPAWRGRVRRRRAQAGGRADGGCLRRALERGTGRGLRRARRPARPPPQPPGRVRRRARTNRDGARRLRKRCSCPRCSRRR